MTVQCPCCGQTIPPPAGPRLVWLPLSGKKWHVSRKCATAKGTVAVKVSRRAAEEVHGRTPCGKCAMEWKDG